MLGTVLGLGLLCSRRSDCFRLWASDAGDREEEIGLSEVRLEMELRWPKRSITLDSESGEKSYEIGGECVAVGTVLSNS